MSQPGSSAYLIPLIPQSQQVRVQLSGTYFNLTVTYRNDPGGQGGYVLDFSDDQNNPILQGISMVVGVDLLAQYEYEELGGILTVASSSGQPGPVPFDGWGNDYNLYWIPD